MQILFTIVLGAAACAWVILGTQLLAGIRRMPGIASATPLPDAALPSVSILFSARDEAEKMPTALRSMLTLDYPKYDVIAVDDRSTDGTTKILREFAAGCKLLRTLRVEELPEGWLGKPHGLETAYEQSSGEWLVFTDADVNFHPELLRRAASLALERGWDHMTIFPLIDMSGFWEKTLISYFMLGGFLVTQPWDIPDPKSGSYAGAGAFQLVRRSAYERMGTHRRLAMEVVDDMQLAALVKAAGYRSGVALPDEMLRLRWHSGVANIVRGTEKNFFAVSRFRLPVVLAQIASGLFVSVLPFLGVFLLRGWAQIAAGVAVACAVAVHARIARLAQASPLYGLTHPLGALLICFMSARSAYLTLRQGGIYWRGTFYPLEALRRGAV